MGSRGEDASLEGTQYRQSSSQPTISRLMPTNTATVVVCSMRERKPLTGSDHSELPTTGSAPAPTPPTPIRTDPTIPVKIPSRSRSSSAPVKGRAVPTGLSVCSRALREPAVPMSGQETEHAPEAAGPSTSVGGDGAV
jgi:hypothetical protein